MDLSLITAGVITAAIAMIANVIVALMNNARLKSIERDKFSRELVHYRYTTLYDILTDLEGGYTFITYPKDIGRTYQEAWEKREKYLSLYKKSRPLLDQKFRKILDAAAMKEESEYKKASKLFMERNTGVQIADLLPWGEVVKYFVHTLSEQIQEQIIHLTNSK